MLKKIKKQLPKKSTTSPVLFEDKNKADLSEREILYKVLFDMKKDLNELRQITFNLINKQDNNEIITNIDTNLVDKNKNQITLHSIDNKETDSTLEIEESLSLFEQEKAYIEKSLAKNKGRRKNS